jgi:hypothetical protein
MLNKDSRDRQDKDREKSNDAVKENSRETRYAVPCPLGGEISAHEIPSDSRGEEIIEKVSDESQEINEPERKLHLLDPKNHHETKNIRKEER